MAENVGTITVAIEAQTAELQAGLAKAERAVKQSSKNMEQQTEKLAKRAENSWTEFASKMGVIQQVGAIAQQVWNGLDGILTAVTDSSANASQKLTGSLDAIEAAGIPVLSQFLAIGRGIGEWISGEKALRAEIERTTAAIQQRAQAQLEAYNKRKENRDNLKKFDDEILQGLADQVEMGSLATDNEKLALKQKRELAALEEKHADLKSKAARGTTQEFLDAEQQKFDEAKQHLLTLQEMETDALEKLQKERADALAKTQEREAAALAEKEQREREAIERKEQAELARIEREKKAEEAAAQAVANKTLDLQTQLDIMIAKQAGDEEKARVLAINARYNKMKEGATEAQRAIIEQMQQIEMSASKTANAVAPPSAVGGGEAGGGAGGTSGISTAIGGFTVATGGGGEQKKQTSLLKAIADSNEEVARAIKKGASSGGIVVAA